MTYGSVSISVDSLFPRWHANRQNPVENKKKSDSKSASCCPSTSGNRHEEDDKHQKQHAEKNDKRTWDNPHFQHCFLRSSLLETAGFVGTAVALCLNIHHRHYKTPRQYDKARSSCLFSKLAFSMPQVAGHRNVLSIGNGNVLPSGNSMEYARVSTTEKDEIKPEKPEISSKDIDSALEELDKLMIRYAASVGNATGCQYLNTDEEAAFCSFKKSADLGSAAGYYNLGLCYEQGKGTTVNLKKAAYCYRQAVLRGHGLASFNLAVYFLKGMGDLPIDTKTARLLMLEASDQGVPEAQVYIGIEYLEEEMWDEAFAMFSDLSSKNNTEGQYYLGLCYKNGWGIDLNEAQAIEMFSQAASKGHPKATLNLGKYYEEGRGSCDENKEFALSLYRILADKGDKEGVNAVKVLKDKLKSSSLAILNASMKLPESRIHLSTSVPDLNCDKKTKGASKFESTTPPFLDLAAPFVSQQTNETCKLEKPRFYIGDEKSNLSLSYLKVLPFHHVGPQLMSAKT